MPTIIGTEEVSALSRHLVMPVITDQVYSGNALFWRWNRAAKKMYEGGMHIEAPFITSTWANGGAYSGFDELSTAPNETTKNGGWDWKQHYVPVSFDARTLIRMNTTKAAANIIQIHWEQARMAMANNLGNGLYSDGSNTDDLDGLEKIVDDGTVATTYAGLTRASNTYLNAQVDSSTATLSWTALQNMRADTNKGGHHATIWLSRVEQYNRFLSLGAGNVQYPIGPSGHDEQLLSAGFTNALFEGVPWVVDDKVFDGPNTSNSAILALDETVFEIAIVGNRDFYMRDFQTPVNQDAMVGFLFWMGNVICRRPQTQGIFKNISA